MKRIAIVLLFAALQPASAEPLATNDTPLVNCAYYNALSPPEAMAFARGFFVASTMGQPLVWYAVVTWQHVLRRPDAVLS